MSHSKKSHNEISSTTQFSHRVSNVVNFIDLCGVVLLVECPLVSSQGERERRGRNESQGEGGWSEVTLPTQRKVEAHHTRYPLAMAALVDSFGLIEWWIGPTRSELLLSDGRQYSQLGQTYPTIPTHTKPRIALIRGQHPIPLAYIYYYMMVSTPG